MGALGATIYYIIKDLGWVFGSLTTFASEGNGGTS